MRRWALLAVALAIPACSNDPTVGAPSPRFGLHSPANGAIGISGTPTFSWTVSHGTSTYQLQISTDPGFGALVFDQGGIASTSTIPAVTLTDGTIYYWRVIAEQPTGDVFSDGAFSFTTVTAVPGAFTLTSPANLTTGAPLTPAFAWTSSLGTASYHLQVATDAGFGTIVAEQTSLQSTSTALTTPLSAMTVYFWRVLAESASTTTASNAPFSFTTLQPVSGSFTMSSPANGAIGVPTVQPFTWTASTGATSYRLEVALDNAFTQKSIDQSNINTTSFTPSLPLLQGRQYFWRVTATSAAGDTAASPSPFMFTTL